MVTEINFKFYKGLKGIEMVLAPRHIIMLDKLDKTVNKGIEIVLAPRHIIMLDKLDKTVKIDIFIKVISRDTHSVTLFYFQ